MEKANLPLESAREPDEQARQPTASENCTMPRHEDNKKSNKKQNITFAESEKNEVSSQSNSSTNKEGLSQPLGGMTHRQKLHWLQKRRGMGLWVQCDDCQRWRWLPDVLDSHELPDRWYCKNNPDSKMANCSIAEAPLRVREEEDLIYAEYSCGSLVWARMAGWPWWPAMVDDCPDNEQFYWLDGFSDIPTYYNVVFFDAFDTTRAWVAPESLRPFESNIETFRSVLKIKKYKKRLDIAVKQANDASMLTPVARLEKYSFITRFKGPVVTPKKISQNVLKMHQKKLERKYKVSFPIESSDEDFESDSGKQDDSSEKKPKNLKRKNVIIVGTPKSKKPRLHEEDIRKGNKGAQGNVTIVGTPKTKKSQPAVEKSTKSESIMQVVEKVPEKYTPIGSDIENITTRNNKPEKSRDLEIKHATETPTTKQPCRLREILEDSINHLQDSLLDTTNAVNSVRATDTNNLMESEPTADSTNIFKEPNSLAAQCGSTKTAIATSDSPQMENLTPFTGKMIFETQTVSEPGTVDDSEYRDTLASSPSSDDFEF